MNIINYKGYDIHFDISSSFHDGFSNTYTIFYYGEEEISHKRFLFFGKTITKKVPRKILSVEADIYDSNYSKEFWKRYLDKVIEIIKREEEIEKNIFV